MIIKQLFDPQTCTLSYLLGDSASGEALIIDPVVDQLNCYLDILEDLELSLKIATDTHCHADHITAMGELRRLTGCETHIGKPSAVECASAYFSDGEEFGCSNITLRAMHTPGHTDDSFCFFLDGAEPAIYSGDTLLIGGTGRTDFQNGSTEALYHSLFDRVLNLPAQTIVYPGHDYNGNKQSTIATEKANNPRLQVSSWQELAEILDQLNLSSPKLMDVATIANQQCGNLLSPFGE